MEVPWSRDGACKRNLHRKAQRCTAVSADCIDPWISSEVFTIHIVQQVRCVVCDVQLFITRVAMVQLMQGLVGRGQR